MCREQKEKGPGGDAPRPEKLVQLRGELGCTSAEYVTGELWLKASLPGCPAHPEGGCGFHKHGSYARVEPPGIRIPRFYCPTARKTFSVLPDFLCSHLSSTMAEVEQVVRHAQVHGVEATAARMQPQSWPSVGERWVRRRLYAVVACLVTLQGLYPERLAQCSPDDVSSYERVLDTTEVLPALRGLAEPSVLQKLIKPAGFRQGKVVHKPP